LMTVVVWHAGLSTKILNKIVVENCNSSCEYENRGTITITLQNIKLWVDPVNGHLVCTGTCTRSLSLRKSDRVFCRRKAT